MHTCCASHSGTEWLCRVFWCGAVVLGWVQGSRCESLRLGLHKKASHTLDQKLVYLAFKISPAMHVGPEGHTDKVMGLYKMCLRRNILKVILSWTTWVLIKWVLTGFSSHWCICQWHNGWGMETFRHIKVTASDYISSDFHGIVNTLGAGCFQRLNPARLGCFFMRPHAGLEHNEEQTGLKQLFWSPMINEWHHG